MMRLRYSSIALVQVHGIQLVGKFDNMSKFKDISPKTRLEVTKVITFN